MDNSVSQSQSLFQSSESSIPTASFTSSSTSSSDGFSWTTWLLIILILAFLGFNVFVYLAQGTQTVADTIGPLIKAVFGTTVAVAGETVDVAAEGAKKVVGKTADVIESGLTAVQEITPNPAHSSAKGQSVQKPVNQGDQNRLHQTLNTPSQQGQGPFDYQAHEASSSVHSAGKAGWCYVGQDRGFRACAEVGADDTCMSGDIFPTHEICMNPNLRN